MLFRSRRAPLDATQGIALTIDQATGRNLPTVLAARRALAARPGGWTERIPLGALLADLGDFAEAEHTYLEALGTYPDVSPFGPALAAFQLGVLYGESMPEPDTTCAAQWYAMAIDYVPRYVKPRVHLAEIFLQGGRADDAIALLEPVLESGDPEVAWRLADAMLVAHQSHRSAAHLAAAAAGFEALLQRYTLAFADHGAEFYIGSGARADRAYALAMLNLGNRHTPRALQLACDTARAAGHDSIAANLERTHAGCIDPGTRNIQSQRGVHHG